MAKKKYIERGALLTLVPHIDGETTIQCVARAIEHCPAADVVEVRHGCWIDNHNGTFTCSVCGGRASKMAWCGRCGAKMDGERKMRGNENSL